MLNTTVVRFDDLPWKSVGEGAREKRIATSDRTLRLLELAEGFSERDWCSRQHVGYVIEGRLKIEFAERTEELEAGEGIVLGGGESCKHRAAVVRGPVRLFLVEPA